MKESDRNAEILTAIFGTAAAILFALMETWVLVIGVGTLAVCALIDVIIDAPIFITIGIVVTLLAFIAWVFV